MRKVEFQKGKVESLGKKVESGKDISLLASESRTFTLKSGTDYEKSRTLEGKSRKLRRESRTLMSESRTTPLNTRTPTPIKKYLLMEARITIAS